MMHCGNVFSFVCLILLLLGCSSPSGDAASPSKTKLSITDSLSQFAALPKTISHPADNPPTPEKIKLGKLLFFDPILSGSKDVACATCHHPSTGYAETLPISIGVNGKGFGSKRHFVSPNEIPFTKRNAHTIINTAFNGIDNEGNHDPKHAPMFWDLRVESLEKQALEPIKALEEMRGLQHEESEVLEIVIRRLKAIPEYRQLFADAFGEENEIDTENLGKAIAAFERSLVTNNSRFDQYMRGDKTAISLSELDGFMEFKKAGCGNCHNGPMFSDFKMHVLGVPESELLPEPDTGLNGTYAFRTPTLRNLRFTFPYMHNGSLNSLQRVLEFYEDISDGKNRNPDVPNEQLDPLIDEVELRVKNMNPIISFLNTLNDTSFDKSEPESVPSGLPVGGNIGN